MSRDIPVAQIVFKEKYVTISFDPTTGFVLLDWHSYATSGQFRHTITTLLAFVESKSKSHAHIGLLADTVKLGVITKEDIEWNAKEINPYIFKAGVKKVAFIIPENIFTQLSITTYQQQTKVEDTGSLISQMFADRASAQKWLSE